MRALLAVTLLIGLLWPTPVLADITGTARVIDGDTIDIAGERIRFHGIDAPESGQSCVAGGERWRCGEKATDALVDFIGSSPVRAGRQEFVAAAAAGECCAGATVGRFMPAASRAL